MKKVIKNTIVSLAVCLSLTASGLAQSAGMNSNVGAANFQRPDKEKEKPKEREKNGGDEKREPKRDDKKPRKPDFF